MNKEHSSNNSVVRRRAHGPHAGGGEKPNDFKGTWKKLLHYCRRYAAAIVVALLCAVFGTVLMLIGPDKLSEMTDTITNGLKPDTSGLEAVYSAMADNYSKNLEKTLGGIIDNLTDNTKMEENTQRVVKSEKLSAEEKSQFSSTMVVISKLEDPQKAQELLFSLPDSVLDVFYGDIEINGVKIPASDQISTVRIMSSISLADGDKAATAELTGSFPETVKLSLYSDINIDGKTITAADQKKMNDIMSNVDSANVEDAAKKMADLPESIKLVMHSSVDMNKIWVIGITLIILYAASYLLSVTQGMLMATVTQRVSKLLRGDISRKINRLPMWYFDRTSTGDVLSRVTNDVDSIAQSLNQSIGTLISAVVLLFGSLFMMLKTNGIMTLTAILASVIGFVIMFAIMGRSQKYFSRQQKHLGQIDGHIEEIFSGHRVVKAYNGEEKAQQDFDKMNADLCESSFKAQCLSGMMMPLMGFIGNLGYVAVCVVGGALALNGQIGFGVIVAFIIYVRYFTQPLSQIAQSMQSLQSAAAAGERVFGFLEAEEMDDESGKTEGIGKTKGTVEFSHVRFGYEGTDKTIIHDFSAKIKPGQKIAIVGPTGAGKTTLVNLLMRFHEIQDGMISIDGISTRDMKREDVHSQFCMVLQDTWLFEGTVRENLVYCTEGVSESKMQKACKAVGLDHFIQTLPNGYDTILNDQVSLSQGQRQQLTIARAMIADRPMLILDEATSSVDTKTELKIQRAMDKLMENRTSFIIAHRLSTIRNADLILVLRDGEIVESGTHNELMKKNGFYSELYNSQFEQPA